MLPDILPQAGKPPNLSTLRGALFRNRFDQETGVEIAPDVVVNIKNVIHGRKFDPAAAELKSLEYIALGKPGEIYLAHLITRPPDFDHVVRVTFDKMPAEESLRRGIILTIPLCATGKTSGPPPAIAACQPRSAASTVMRRPSKSQSSKKCSSTRSSHNWMCVMATTFEIHPSIGIARVGNSQQHFVGPEPDTSPPTQYRDAAGELLRQAARFRVFECERDEEGVLLG